MKGHLKVEDMSVLADPLSPDYV